jgi:glycosyltransferase involved in cell wall biosynthesis
MRVAVVNLTSGGFSGGFSKYLHELLPLLRDDSRVSHVDVHMPSNASVGLPPGFAARSWPADDYRTDFSTLKRRLREGRADVVFIPTARFIESGLPTLVMVRNMEPLVRPIAGNSAFEAARNLARRVAAKRSCQKATAVIAVSDYVRDFLQERWKIPAQKISVVPHGVNPPSRPTSRQPISLSGLSPSVPIIFTAGSIRPARGVEDVIAALADLKRQGILAHLVIAGGGAGDSTRYKRRLERYVRHHGLSQQVIWAGQLSREEMSWCFFESSAFVMTSRVEACPNLVLEALAHAALSVSVSSRPMPEFFGESASYYEPGNARQLSSELARLLNNTDQATREGCRSRARDRAAEYRWERTAALTVEALLRCANRGARPGVGPTRRHLGTGTYR